MNKKKLSLNQIVFLSSGITALIIAITLLIIFALTYRPSIAFYKVPDQVKKALYDYIIQNTKENYRFIELDSSVPLSKQSKKFASASFIFVNQDCDSKEFAQTSSKIKSLPVDLTSNIPDSVQKSLTIKKNGVKYLPILYDFYQIDVNYENFQKSPVKNINYWQDLVDFLYSQKASIKTPLIFDGGDSPCAIDIFGMILESASSPEEYSQLLDKIYDIYKNQSDNLENFAQEFTQLINSNEACIKSKDKIKELIQSGILDKSILQFERGSSVSLAGTNSCAALITKLSDHRKISHSVIRNYKSIYCPSYPDNFKRKFAAPEIALLCLKKSKKNILLAEKLIKSGQSEISTNGGLSPVDKNCTPSDLQADDVRYWIAASSGPLLPLSAAIPDDKFQKEAAQILYKFD
ncbi:MAG: hypothetical protein K5866_05415 [Treponema sp.]|nr:hypothetical protein [Treponema sp.]